jgi:protein disulfide-isomerase A6
MLLTLKIIDYQGPRDAKSMVDFFLSSQPSNVQFVKWNEKDVKSKKSITWDNFLQTKVLFEQYSIGVNGNRNLTNSL